MKVYDLGGLRVEMKHTRNGMEMHWFGRSDTRDPAAVLQPFFDSVKGQLKNRHVLIDFRSFEYMNSSTVRPLLNFFQDTQANGQSVRVRYDAAKNWQRLSFKAVQALASDWPNVSFEGS